MIRRVAVLTLLCLGSQSVFGQCAPAPDSAYFFRDLSEKRATAKIEADRKVFEELLSDSFVARDQEGKPLSRKAFIDAQLAAAPGTGSRRFHSISNYTLVEHRKGYTVASYQLIEGTSREGHAEVVESQVREVYEVVEGKWRLASLESAPLPPVDAPTAARRTP